MNETTVTFDDFRNELLQAKKVEGPIAERINQNVQELLELLPIAEVNDPRTLVAIASAMGVAATLFAVHDRFEEVLN